MFFLIEYENNGIDAITVGPGYIEEPVPQEQ